jgi:hypothetical protein
MYLSPVLRVSFPAFRAKLCRFCGWEVVDGIGYAQIFILCPTVLICTLKFYMVAAGRAERGEMFELQEGPYTRSQTQKL